MKKLVFIIFISINLFAQDKKAYLKENRFDMLASDFRFPKTDFDVIGFGAYHGSAKTYEVEKLIINDLKRQGVLDYYFPETNFSQAFYFQKYLENGDEKLLKDLVLAFQSIVNQEGTIETFNHWKNLRELNKKYPQNPVQILGCDVINEYKFPIKHILYLTENIQNWEERRYLEKIFLDENTDFGIDNESLEKQLKSFIESYRRNKGIFEDKIKNIDDFHFILKNIEYNFNDKRDREQIIFDNYIYLKEKYQLGSKKQFFKYGFFHIQKSREGDYPSFFTRLIEQNIYEKNKVLSVMGYLTKSKVLWNKIYDKQGNYKTYTIEKGYGIGDYWKEYFRGIGKLKKLKLSDITLFRLNAENSPYHKGTDLMEVKQLFKKSNKAELKGKNTTDFIDFAVLISHSENQIPLEEIFKKIDGFSDLFH